MDPFYLIKQEILTDIEHIHELIDTRNDMIHDHRGINIDVFKKLGAQMTNESTAVRGLLKDIKESIDHVRANPEQFQVSELELNNRTSFVQNTENELNEIDEKIKDQSNNQKVLYKSNFESKSTIDNNNNFEGNPNNGNAQSSLLEEHAEQINMIEESVSMQLQIAREIGHEFDDQQEIIIQLDENITSADEAMKSVTAKIKNILENEGKLPTSLAFGLSILLIILLFFAI
ncbi:hypothetical protein TRFO_27748 [Tritrichomonas foetus]|uniref:t-SNARE coiled-coil homology domain-containing protein n=1 Tax=Tritrichomonas foetus TaxID=1144522 RepID=A0A1J4JZT4_9EUKA|nr:hypothetical protein TRFO_27748 [Tritrichomonas foetus]|eukprot:OHT04673.1 hypothetical protein TRFO_27748 [Tritrichomonas foetus]